jgi:hypothetical protein
VNYGDPSQSTAGIGHGKENETEENSSHHASYLQPALTAACRPCFLQPTPKFVTKVIKKKYLKYLISFTYEFSCILNLNIL